MLDTIVQMVAGAGDPNLVARLIPDSAVWPHYLAVMLRAYRIPEYLFWIGLFLLLGSMATSALRYMAGQENLLSMGLRFAVLWALWGVAVVTPAMNGCNPTYATTPCVLKGNWVVQKVSLADEKVDVPTLAPDGTIEVKEVAVNQKPVYRISFNPISAKDNDSPLGRTLKGMWQRFNTWSNQALFREMARQQSGISQAKRALNELMVAIVLGSGAAGAASTLGSYLGMLGSFMPGIGGFLSSVGGAALESTADTTLRLVQGVGGSLVSAMLFGPVALLTVYHAINTLSGALLYVVLFGAPVLLGLAGFLGLGFLLGTLRLLLVVLLIPLITAPVFGTALRVIYGGMQEKESQLRELNQVAQSLLSQNDPSKPFRTMHAVRIATTQMGNALACAEALLVEKGTGSVPGVFCPDRLEDLFYTDAADWHAKAEALRAKAKAKDVPEFIGQHALSVPAILALPKGVTDHKKAAEALVSGMKSFLGGGGDATASLVNRAKMEEFLKLVKVYRPGFIWSWPAYTEYMRSQFKPPIPKDAKCSDKNLASQGYMAAMVGCLNGAIQAGAKEPVEIKEVKAALEKAKRIDQKFQAGGFPKGSLGFDGWDETAYGSNLLPTNLGTALFANYANTQKSSGGAAGLFYPIDKTYMGYQPTLPYVALDNAYLHVILAQSLPGAVMAYAQDGTISTVVATLVATLISLLLMSATWGLLGQLIGAAGDFTGQVGGSTVATVAGTASVTGVNLAAGAPTTSAADRAAQEAARAQGRKPPPKRKEEENTGPNL